MKTKIIIFLCGILVSGQLMAQDSVNEEINWVSFTEAWELNKKEPKPIFIDFYTDWCGWCKRMDKTTFKDTAVVALMNEGFYAVKFDAEQKEDIVIEGTTYSFVDNGRRGYNQLAADLMDGKMSYPTYVFLENSVVQTRVPGYQQAKDFHKILKFMRMYSEDKTLQWDSFDSVYESPYPAEKEN